MDELSLGGSINLISAAFEFGNTVYPNHVRSVYEQLNEEVRGGYNGIGYWFHRFSLLPIACRYYLLDCIV